MQKHRGEDVRNLTSGIGNAYQSVAHWEFHSRRQCAGEFPRNQAEITDGFGEGSSHARALNKNPDEHAQRDDADGHVRWSLGLVFVAIGEHGSSPPGSRSLAGADRLRRDLTL